MFQVKRSALISVLLVLLFLSFIHYGSLEPEPELGYYPSEEHLIKDYGAYVDQRVSVGGKVIRTEPLTLRLKYGDETMEVTVIDAEESPKVGDVMSVYGVLREGDRIEAINTVNRSGWGMYYMYGVSVIAAFWIAIRIFRQYHWEGSVKPKEEGHG